MYKEDDDMEGDLMKLRNTMMMVETRGESTKIMAKCIDFVEQMIAQEQGRAAKERMQTENKNKEVKKA